MIRRAAKRVAQVADGVWKVGAIVVKTAVAHARDQADLVAALKAAGKILDKQTKHIGDLRAEMQALAIEKNRIELELAELKNGEGSNVRGS